MNTRHLIFAAARTFTAASSAFAQEATIESAVTFNNSVSRAD